MLIKFLWIFVTLLTFVIMEFVAWFSHKYIMHGFLWSLHKDHHIKDHKSWFERNDFFFIFYAIVSLGFALLWGHYGIWFGLPIAFGIFLYGLTYFLVHDIFIHRRIKIFTKPKNSYLRAVLYEHRKHHANEQKENGEFFGMLFVSFKSLKALNVKNG